MGDTGLDGDPRRRGAFGLEQPGVVDLLSGVRDGTPHVLALGLGHTRRGWGDGAVDQTKALWPVIALPTMRVFISRLPSKE